MDPRERELHRQERSNREIRELYDREYASFLNPDRANTIGQILSYEVRDLDDDHTVRLNKASALFFQEILNLSRSENKAVRRAWGFIYNGQWESLRVILDELPVADSGVKTIKTMVQFNKLRKIEDEHNQIRESMEKMHQRGGAEVTRMNAETTDYAQAAGILLRRTLIPDVED